MLTQEQIQNLKPGDPLIIHGEYINQLSDGDITIKCNITRGGEQTTDRKFFHPSCVSLPSESARTFCHVVDNMVKLKHDPTRLFRKGDKVKRRTVDGRTDPDVPEGIDLTVTTDEAKYGNVRVQDPHGRSIVTKAVFLELITPMEELEPYTQGGGIDEQSIYKNGDFYAELKDAKEAERVCKLLNAEYRKEYGND